MRKIRTLCFGLLLTQLAACEGEALPSPPVSLDVGTAIAELYRRAGVAQEVASKNVLGMHYRSGSDSWKVVACMEFKVPDGQNAGDCNDSFELYQLNSGRWIVSGTVNGQYIWLEMIPGGQSSGSA